MKPVVSIVTCVLLYVCVNSIAQVAGAVPDNIRATNTLDRLSDGGISAGEVLIGMPVPAGELVGDVYLSENWTKSTFMLMNADKLYEGYNCRYNIQANQLEIKTSTAVSAVPGAKIKSFVWIEGSMGTPTYFINAQDYTVEGVKQTGFLSVLADGSLPFFKKTIIVIRQPDYKPELSMGNRDTQILKKDIFYYARNKELIEIKGSKRKFLEIFGDAAPEIEKYIDLNSMDVSKINHRVLIFDYYNNKIASAK